MPCDEVSDDALLARVADGDERASRAVVDRHLGRVLILARRMLGNPTEAEDVAQDTFLALWRHAGRWRRGEAQLATWLYKVASNRCLDRLRRRPLVALDEAPEPTTENEAERDHHRRDVSAAVEAALCRLPERQRLAIGLCHYQELGNIEAAALMEISVEALESLLSRGRRALRAELAERLPDLLGEP
jgi:RNA polymerase sigma-70 factor (ECF subfamily)